MNPLYESLNDEHARIQDEIDRLGLNCSVEKYKNVAFNKHIDRMQDRKELE